VSHDLRTPAHAIMLLSTLIRREAESRKEAGVFSARCRRIPMRKAPRFSRQ